MQLKVDLNLDFHDKNILERKWGFKHDPSSNFMLTKNQSGYLCLYIKTFPRFHPVFVDFYSQKIFSRVAVGKRKDSLFKAVKVANKENPTILDATAGFGRDAATLSQYGFSVSLLERNKLLSALLSDGVERLNDSISQNKNPSNCNINLLCGVDFFELSNQGVNFDVVYLDPMFPVVNYKSLVKKESQFLQAIVGSDLDQDNLLQPAMNIALKKVVVKRLCSSDYLNNKTPSYSIKSKVIRFDIYLV